MFGIILRNVFWAGKKTKSKNTLARNTNGKLFLIEKVIQNTQ